MAFLATLNSMCMGTVTAARHRGLAIDGGAAGVEVRRRGQLYPLQLRLRPLACGAGLTPDTRPTQASNSCRWTLKRQTLESGTGDMGKLPVIRTLATLAHDCRRSELFQGELLAALQIVQRGDLHLRDLIGASRARSGRRSFYHPPT
jgi:Transglycosylase SLT domain